MSANFDYEYRGLIGQGGMANVFLFERVPRLDESSKVRKTRTKAQPVAVKQVRTDLDSSQRILMGQMFDLECENVRTLSSAHVVHTYGVDDVAGVKSIVMEWVDGCTLQDILGVLKERSGLQSKQVGSGVSGEFATRLLRGLLLGLKDIHSFRGDDGVLQCLVHRDLTPKNVLISRSGEVKIADFGISKLNAGQTGLKTQAKHGTKGYVAPELKSNAQRRSVSAFEQQQSSEVAPPSAYDERLDLYHVGLILFEVLFAEGFEQWRVAKGYSLETLRVPLRERLSLLEDQDPALLDLVASLLESEPEHRTSSAQEGFNQIRQLYFGGSPDPETELLVDQARAKSGAEQNDTEVAPAEQSEQAPPEPGQAASGGRVSRRALGLVAVAVATLGGLVWYLNSEAPTSVSKAGAFQFAGDVVRDSANSSPETEAEVLSPSVDSDDRARVRPLVRRLEVHLEALLGMLQDSDEANQEATLGALEQSLALYLQLVASSPEEPHEGEAWRCRGGSSQSEIEPSSLDLCRDLDQWLEAHAEEIGVSIEELAKRLGQEARNTELVKRSVKALEAWTLDKASALVLELRRATGDTAPPGAFGARSLRTPAGQSTGFGSTSPISEAFSPEFWTNTGRSLACGFLSTSRGWVHLLSAEERYKLDPRARFFEAYGDASTKWLTSMRWTSKAGRGGAEPFDDLQWLATKQDSMFDMLVGQARDQGRIKDWACDFEVNHETRVLPFVVQVEKVLGDQRLRSDVQRLAVLLLSKFDASGRPLGGFKEIDARYRSILQKTKRSHDGSDRATYEGPVRSALEMLAWGRARLLQVEEPRLAEPVAPRAETFETRWCRQIQRPFAKRFAGRYPFSTRGRSFATLRDVRKFLHPETGDLWVRVSRMDGYLRREGNRFVALEKPADGSKPLSRQAIAFLSQAWALSQALFGGRDRGRPFVFELSLPESDQIKTVELDLGDGPERYRLDRPNRIRFSWPSSSKRPAFIAAHSNAESIGFRISASKGPWSTLWLFEQAKLVSDAKRRVRLRWQTPKRPGLAVVADLRSLGRSDLLFGPDWSPSGFLRVLRLRAPAKPFQGGHGCSEP